MLPLLENFFSRLNSSGIRYCHWKSNSHLKSGLLGDTDLDLLVHENQRQQFEQSLVGCDFKRVMSPRLRHYPGIEHYLGLDSDTGKIAHLHVHYRLIVGRRYFKNYHLPVEDFMLGDLRSINGVYVPCVEGELLLLVIRASMKLSFFDILNYIAGKRAMPLPEGLCEEFGWVQSDFDDGKLADASVKSGLPVSVRRVVEFARIIREGRLKVAKIVVMRSHVLRALRPLRLQPPLQAFRRALLIRFRSATILTRFLPAAGKTFGGRGKTIALVGADGSGKTTMCGALTKRLGRKLWVERYYLGSGQPTLFNRFLRLWVIPMLVPHRLWPREAWARLLRHYGHGVIELLNARDRLVRFRKGFRSASKGCMVFFDRYPVWGVADQPALLKKEGEFASEPLARWIVKRVYGTYRQIREPDLLIHLSLPPEVASSRKPQHDKEVIAAKEARLKVLSEQSAGNGKVFVVDASKSQEGVLHDILMEVWRSV